MTNLQAATLIRNLIKECRAYFATKRVQPAGTTIFLIRRFGTLADILEYHPQLIATYLEKEHPRLLDPLSPLFGAQDGLEPAGAGGQRSAEKEQEEA